MSRVRAVSDASVRERRRTANSSPTPNSPLAPSPRVYPSAPNYNTNWQNKKGTWITNILIVALVKMVFSIMPGINKGLSWTLTNVSYNLGHFIMFHWMIGAPFESSKTGGEFDGQTMWEQMDSGDHYTATKKFLTALPILIFLATLHYNEADISVFIVNFALPLINCIAKIPSMHRVRVFGINKGPNESEPELYEAN